MFNIAENAKLVEAITPQAGAAITGDYVSLKGAARCFIIVSIAQAAANTVAIVPYQATSCAAAGEKVLATAVPIWLNESCAATDTLVKQTAAVNYTTSAGTTHKMVVLEIDPMTLDRAAGFDCITVKTGASAAGNITSAFYLLTDLRYQGATPASAVVD